MRPADKAWVTLGVGVLAYEIAADEGELFSDAADRWMLSHPWITRAVVASVAMHLCNAIPDSCDPLHWLFGVKRMLRASQCNRRTNVIKSTYLADK